MTPLHPWFRQTTLYQIYPRSFYDSTGDGTGDLQGIIQKLDYLKGGPKSLGVDSIWLSPFYPSPMADFGYDVSNYCDVDPLFGTLHDFDTLVKEAHKRDIKVLIDFVPNHTSNHHPWFEESRSSRHNKKRDWYTWRDPKPDGSPPNNWLSIFGGSVWEFDNNTNQYYLHSFLKEQPDLNWENPEVRHAMKQVMRFWFDRGVDGFRIDAVQWIGKDPELRDDPKNPDYHPGKDWPYGALRHLHSKRGPTVYAHLKEMTAVAREYRDRLLVAEAYPHKRFEYDVYLDLYEKVDPSVLAPFNFEAIFLPWKARAYKRYIDGFQSRLHPDYLPVYAMGNHDTHRIMARYGLGPARTIAVLLMSLPGIPVIYYGDELGMNDVPIPRARARDPIAKSVLKTASRDPERTPMQWTPGQRAGFSKVTAWLPIGNHRHTNVQYELTHDGSMLHLYRELLALRQRSLALQRGTYRPLECYSEDIFAFAREYGEEKLAVILNFSGKKTLKSPFQGKVLASSARHVHTDVLQPHEGRIVSLS